ncbi:hypothetical protein RRG08_035929 [Elysia crispata]|uniref:Uncharacterized protein n=1 Tax=Elysia crispata TaxID=231223 RepID=A0AAE1DR87_9GAST|nr:hypothetical protein RRG08_035929 [Elysia crispata]
MVSVRRAPTAGTSQEASCVSVHKASRTTKTRAVKMLTSVLLICVGKTQRVRIPREAILANAMKVSFNKTGVVLVSYCP